MQFLSRLLMIFILVLSLAIMSIDCRGEKSTAVDRFISSIQGEWKLESINLWGSTAPPGMTYNLSIEGQTVRSILPGNRSLGSLKWELSGSGPVFNLDMVRGRPDGMEEVVCAGLCKIQDGKLVRIFRITDKGRPKTFNINDEVGATKTIHVREKH